MKRYVSFLLLIASTVSAMDFGDIGGNSVNSGSTPVSGGTNLGIFYQSGGVITNGTGATFDGTSLTATAYKIGSLTGTLNTGSMGPGAGYYWSQGTSQGLQFNLPTFIGTNLQFNSGTQLFADNGTNAAPAIAGENVTTTGFKWATTPSLSVVVGGSSVSTFTASGLSLASLATGALPAAITVTTSNVSATGTPSATTYFRGDNSWATVAGGMTVGNAVTGGSANAVLYEDGSQNLAASSTMTYSGTTFALSVATVTLGANGALGGATGPLLGFTGGTNNTGFYNGGSALNPVISFSYKGTDIFDFAGSAANAVTIGTGNGTLKLAQHGSAGAPGLAITGNSTGMFTPDSTPTRLSFAIAGTEMLNVNATGVKIGSAANATQALDVTGQALISGLTTTTGGLLIQISTGPRTNVTPTAAGQIIYNSTDLEVCFSTGTAQNSWVQIRSAATACTH